jgi:hypothetical protein
MEGRVKPHSDKYKEITNDWNYDASCMITSLLVWDSENFKRLVFVVQSVHSTAENIILLPIKILLQSASRSPFSSFIKLVPD